MNVKIVPLNFISQFKTRISIHLVAFPRVFGPCWCCQWLFLFLFAHCSILLHQVPSLRQVAELPLEVVLVESERCAAREHPDDGYHYEHVRYFHTLLVENRIWVIGAFLCTCEPCCVVPVNGHDDEHGRLCEGGDNYCAEDASELHVDPSEVKTYHNDESADGVEKVGNEACDENSLEACLDIVVLLEAAGAVLRC